MPNNDLDDLPPLAAWENGPLVDEMIERVQNEVIGGDGVRYPSPEVDVLRAEIVRRMTAGAP